MSDEDLREIGLTPNAVGQLRSIVKSQTTNGLNQISNDKKLDNTTSTGHSVVDPIENEVTIEHCIFKTHEHISFSHLNIVKIKIVSERISCRLCREWRC